ncbi:MAG: glycoside hydrolase, partial [Firmicutes bacterium]|nr:glycoside hydrolase [Bacillota bacterium]
LLVGMADYGYDWGPRGATCVTMAQAAALARAHHVRIRTCASSGSATFGYLSATGAHHVVWFQDDCSTALTAALVSEFGLAGVVIWHLGAQDPGFWPALTSALRMNANV